MTVALALHGPRANLAATPSGTVPRVLAQGTGLLVSVSAAQVLALATDYFTNYPQFLQDTQAMVQPAILQAETAQPEGTAMQLVITGLQDQPFVGSQASNIASAINSAAASGTLLNTDGTAITGWSPGAPIAYADDATATLTCQWLKGQPWGWIIVGVAVAVLGVVLYYLLQHSSYALSAFEASANLVGNVGGWLLTHWGWVLLGAGAVAVAPYAIRAIARTREAENELRYARRGGR
jgi:hypothetical protein